MKRAIFLLLFSIVTIHTSAQAQLQKDLSLSYLVSQPKTKNLKPKLIVLLHGYGSNEADLFSLKDMIPADFLVVSPRAPMDVAPNAFQWFGNEKVKGINQGNVKDLKTSTGLIKKFISEVVKKYKVDPSQVYLAGFSQGAMMCYEVGLTSPELLKGIAPLSGRIFDSLLLQIKPANSFKHLKIFIGHGSADDRVPNTYATQAAAYLKEKKITAVLHSYQGVQHSISEPELKDLVNWLNEK